MKCYNCGSNLPRDATYCGKCGKKAYADKELMERVLAGDESAQAEIYSRAYETVEYTVRKLLPDKNSVQDVMQEAYITIFGRIGELKEPKTYTAWARQIARNKAIDWMRKNGREIPFTSLAPEGDDEADGYWEDFEDTDTEHMPEAEIGRAEAERLVREIESGLNPNYAEIIVMKDYERLSDREIAETLGISEGAVRTRYSRARKKFDEKVRELEKKGVQLYSFAPVPFFLWLLSKLEPDEAAISAKQAVYEAVRHAVRLHAVGRTAEGHVSAETTTGTAGKSTETGASIKTPANGDTARKTADKAVEKAAASGTKSISTKAVAGIAVAVIGAAAIIGGIYANSGNRQEETTQETIAAETVDADSETMQDYGMDEYAEEAPAVWQDAYIDFMENLPERFGSALDSDCIYALIHIDDDGVPELAIIDTGGSKSVLVTTHTGNGYAWAECDVGNMRYIEKGGLFCMEGTVSEFDTAVVLYGSVESGENYFTAVKLGNANFTVYVDKNDERMEEYAGKFDSFVFGSPVPGLMLSKQSYIKGMDMDTLKAELAGENTLCAADADYMAYDEMMSYLQESKTAEGGEQ